jgi:hypothetical protein
MKQTTAMVIPVRRSKGGIPFPSGQALPSACMGLKLAASVGRYEWGRVENERPVPLVGRSARTLWVGGSERGRGGSTSGARDKRRVVSEV